MSIINIDNLFKVKTIKKLLLSLFILVNLLLLNSLIFVNAGGFVPKIPNPSRFDSGEDIINALAQLIRPAFLIGFAIMLFVGAGTYLTAGSDENKVKNAKNTITAAIIGFILAVMAPTIMNFVSGLLGVQGGLTIL
jgi:hypothetical protein